jgi:hypothetical protein
MSRRGWRAGCCGPETLSGTDTLVFTQEFLAEMLGVQRSSVTLAARMLQQTGITNYSRGKIWIVDVEALQEVACECYAAIKEHHAILLGPETAGHAGLLLAGSETPPGADNLTSLRPCVGHLTHYATSNACGRRYASNDEGARRPSERHHAGKLPRLHRRSGRPLQDIRNHPPRMTRRP